VDSSSFDLEDEILLIKHIKDIQPDIIIHCAGIVNIEDCENNKQNAFNTNVVVTENIAKLCSNKIKMVYISTDQVYGLEEERTEENSNIISLNYYGETKLLGELSVQRNANDFIIIRTNIFGWNVKDKKISSAEWMLNEISKGKQINLFYDYIFSPIYSKLLGKIIIKLIRNNFSGIINIGSPIECSKYSFGVCLADQFSLDKSSINKVSVNSSNIFAKRHKDISMNISKIMNLNLLPPDYKTSIKQFKIDQPF